MEDYGGLGGGEVNCVYVVEEGEYSNYQVVAIFSEKGAADEFSAHRPGSGVVEWTLDTWKTEQSEFLFVFGLDGQIKSVEEKAHIREHEYDGRIFSQAWGDDILVRVCRGPEELAVKIASERYTKIRAFHDQADALCVGGLDCLKGTLRPHLVVMVAEVLAGIRVLPDGPGSGFEEDAKRVLRQKGVK